MSHLRREFSGAAEPHFRREELYVPDRSSTDLSAHMDEFQRLVEQATSNDPTITIEEIFRCYICLGRVRDAHMCPSCSKMCCLSCIKKWLTDQRSQCPHCRSPLRISQLVNCRFVAEVSAELDKLQTIQKQRVREVCKVHNASLYYYCSTCATSICSDCAMFSEQHKGHKFEHLNVVYESHVDAIRKEASSLQHRLKELFSLMQNVEDNIQKISKHKEDCSTELRMVMEQMQGRLDTQMKTKLMELFAQKNSISEEVELLESMIHELNRQLTNNPKSVLISKSTELVRMLQELHRKPISQFMGDPVSLEFNSEVTPKYDGSVFKLKNYSKIRQSAEVVYSDPLHAAGLTWRLKVYPNGNGGARGTFLSVFLEMLRGYPEPSKYEYRVEMLNHRNQQSVVREFASDFEVGECWGYNRFHRIENLAKEGYLHPEEDMIVLNFYVRAITFNQQSRDQKRYIEQLELSRSQAALQIADLKRKLLEQAKGKSETPDTDENGSLRDSQPGVEDVETSNEHYNDEPLASAPATARNSAVHSPHQNTSAQGRRNSLQRTQTAPDSLGRTQHSVPIANLVQTVQSASGINPSATASPRPTPRISNYGVPSLARNMSELAITQTSENPSNGDSTYRRKKEQEGLADFAARPPSKYVPGLFDSTEERTPRTADPLTQKNRTNPIMNTKHAYQYNAAYMEQQNPENKLSPNVPPKYTERLETEQRFSVTSPIGGSPHTLSNTRFSSSVTSRAAALETSTSLMDSQRQQVPDEHPRMHTQKAQGDLSAELDLIWKNSGANGVVDWRKVLKENGGQDENIDDSDSEDLAVLGGIRGKADSGDISEKDDNSDDGDDGWAPNTSQIGPPMQRSELTGLKTLEPADNEGPDDENEDILSNVQLYHKYSDSTSRLRSSQTKKE